MDREGSGYSPKDHNRFGLHRVLCHVPSSARPRGGVQCVELLDVLQLGGGVMRVDPVAVAGGKLGGDRCGQCALIWWTNSSSIYGGVMRVESLARPATSGMAGGDLDVDLVVKIGELGGDTRASLDELGRGVMRVNLVRWPALYARVRRRVAAM